MHCGHHKCHREQLKSNYVVKCHFLPMFGYIHPDAKIGMGVLKGEPAIVAWHAQTWEESDTLILAALCDI